MFILALMWLISNFGNAGRDMWRKLIISYDNMCHLNNLRIAKEPLPLVYLRKVIDDLHMKNHKDDYCRKSYNLDDLKEQNPHLNTMSHE